MPHLLAEKSRSRKKRRSSDDDDEDNEETPEDINPVLQDLLKATENDPEIKDDVCLDEEFAIL
jgi:hypothetical protein